jgi:hypothetical protein
MSRRAIIGLAIGATFILGSVGAALMMRSRGPVDGSNGVFRTLLGFGFAAAAGSVGAGMGAVVSSGNRLRAPGELPVTVALGIISLVGLAMALMMSFLFAASSGR